MIVISLCFAVAFTACNPAVMNDVESDLQKMQGAWKCSAFQREGESDKEMVGLTVKIQANRVAFAHDRLTDENCRIEIEAIGEDGEPGKLIWRQTWLKGLQLDLEFQGIYLLNGDTLMICLPENSSGARPLEFGSSKKDQRSLIILQRLKDAEEP